ncbi:MAG: hypothetical protein IJY50_07610 [Clostridia bacterium]|nr:hypothetical protein [Clostridia bacterium]
MMKKLCYFLLMLVTLLSLTACGGDGQKPFADTEITAVTLRWGAQGGKTYVLNDESVDELVVLLQNVTVDGEGFVDTETYYGGTYRVTITPASGDEICLDLQYQGSDENGKYYIVKINETSYYTHDPKMHEIEEFCNAIADQGSD